MVNNTYTWTITSLGCIPNIEGKLNYVVVSHWNCSGTDGVYVGYVSGTVTFAVDPNKQGYVPYQDLTEAEVIAWTQEALGFDTVQTVYRNIDTQITGQISPPIVTPPLPWEP